MEVVIRYFCFDSRLDYGVKMRVFNVKPFKAENRIFRDNQVFIISTKALATGYLQTIGNYVIEYTWYSIDYCK